jgi:integrase
LAGGGNPNSEKKVEKAKGVTLAEAVAAYQTTRTLKPTTIRDMNVALRHIAEDWMNRPLAKITPAMIEKRHREFAESRSPARANLGMRYLRAVFNFASAKYKDDKGQSLIPPNPVKILSELKAWKRVDRRQTCIQPHQLQPWFEAVMNLPGEDWRDYFRLVLLTGPRREEALGLQWADVDFTGRTLTVRDTKNHSDHTLPLPAYLLDLLAHRKAARAARPMACQAEDVFADESGRRISNLRYAQVGVTRNSGVDFTVHDLRRSFATIAESLDIPAYALKCLLNHTQKSDVTSGYLIVTTERLREPMEKICSYILKAAGQLPTAAVIPIRPGVQTG